MDTPFTRTLGRSGIAVSALGMGCWAIGGPFWSGPAPLGWGEVDDDEAVRALPAALDAEAARIGWPGMHDKLRVLDPITADRLAPNYAQRINRALEIIELTGKPMSALLALRTRPVLPFRLVSFGLETDDRAVLHKRIAQRFDAMLGTRDDSGLVAEVARLRARGDLSPLLPSIRCVGYRQAWDYLDGRIDRATLRETGIIATRQLAKRQITWLRAMPDRIVIDCLGPDPAGAMLAHLALLEN